MKPMLEIPSHQSTEVKSYYKYHIHLQVNFIVTLGSSLLSHHRTFQWSKRRDTTECHHFRVLGAPWSITCCSSLGGHFLWHLSVREVMKKTECVRCSQMLKENLEECWGLPWWLKDREATCAWGRHRFDHWSRRISHATVQPGLCTPTTEPVL